MNNALESYKKNIAGKKAAILGFGISNRPLARTLADWGASVTVFDKKEEEKFTQILPEYREKGISFSFGGGYLDSLTGFEVIFRTPGMRFDLPQIKKALAEGAELTSEMEIFMRLCPAYIYAVTGSDGKTTTTTLIYEILKQEGYNCYLGGNIGTPLLDRVHEIKSGDRVVLELSSFQLHTMQNSPHVAVITNISPNHLDIHKSMEEYIDAKKNIFRFQNESGRVVLNYDNPVTRGFIPEVKGRPVLFSTREEGITGAYIRNNCVVFRNREDELAIMPVADIKLPGMHNVENFMAAVSAVIPEVTLGAIQHIGKSFSGVEHRTEFVRKVNGISFFNDSIATSPTRTTASLKAFKGEVILIAGGYDKKLSYDELGETIQNYVKAIVLLGDTADKIEAAYLKQLMKCGGNPMPVIHARNMEEAVQEAFSLARESDTVLLSPASASFDMYPNFMERGLHFKEIVGRLMV